MVFSSIVFLFIFLPINLLIYYVLKRKYRNYWLLFTSLLFFGWVQPNYLWILISIILVNYFGAVLISKSHPKKKAILIIVVLTNLLPLFIFKYFGFILDSISAITNKEFSFGDIVLPIGISFFTFQGMSYVIDVYKGEVTAQKNIIKTALYIVLFPQLVAGPIVRYKDIASEIDNRKEDINDFCHGIERFTIGLAKKAIIANTMASMVDTIWKNGVESNTCAIAWLGSIGYTLQIYFDFSGYSDMAIGLGRMFGFHFPENFNLPYVSKSISEFWRRWHISLSSWFRDYVYIPLGGNKKNVYLNLLIVFILTGIWHGAGGQFIVWGLWNGLFILIERRFKSKSQSGSNEKRLLYDVLSKLYTLLVVNIGWVLFRAPDMFEGVKYLSIMFGVYKPEKPGFSVLWYIDRWKVFVMLLGLFFASSLPKKIYANCISKMREKGVVVVKYLVLMGLLCYSAIRIVSGTYNPFIYFQF